MLILSLLDRFVRLHNYDENDDMQVNDELAISDAKDEDGEIAMESDFDNDTIWITKGDAEKIVKHLIKVFDLTA